MTVTVVLPAQLRELAAGRSALALSSDDDAWTVGQALEAMRSEHPSVYDRILTEQRELRPHVNLFVGRSDIRWSGGLDTPVPAGSELVILPAVSGG